MDSLYRPQEIERKWAEIWEKGKYFTPKIDLERKPFTILLPLPNANDPLHIGHALFTVEDIMIRYHRMLGEPTLWLPGGDHAGIETQFVYEKKLTKEGKSRFDFDRETLYRMISDFVDQNRKINKDQFKILGFSLDMSRYVYSMEDRVVNTVFQTFRKLCRDGLVYRGNRIVNFCTKCGTSFSDLEVQYEEIEESLYFLDYNTIQIATTRPETIFADVAVAVNPTDRRYKDSVGKAAVVPLVNKKVPIITDFLVQKDFGTGALKITPAHAVNDFEIGQRHNLPMPSVIGRNGRLDFPVLADIHGLKVKSAREKTLELLKNAGKIVAVKPLRHSVGRCYRCKTLIEPLLIPQWFIKTKPLAAKAVEAVKLGKTKIFPRKRFEKMYFDWLENIHDWNISRQIVWGPRIPIWYCLDCNPDITITFINSQKEKITGTYSDLIPKCTLKEIKSGLQSLVAGPDSFYSLNGGVCEKCHGRNVLQETDTFDTWFLSGQWPITSLGANINDLKQSSDDFKYFYPTSVLDTLWDILFFWVARMMMLGLYLTGKVPFGVIHLHARVVDRYGQKMSKSRGNVINPIEMVNKYGADALRMALVMGVAPAGDIFLTDEKVRGMRNFANKLWNTGRFIYLNTYGRPKRQLSKKCNYGYALIIRKEIVRLVSTVTSDIEKYHFGQASEKVYQYVWHKYCDVHLEKVKPLLAVNNEEAMVVRGTLLYSFLIILKLLHPYMPFVTEELHSLLYPDDKIPLVVSSWPKS
jgi:valyl-tRNA synthetase